MRFLSDEAKARGRAAVFAFESKTSAELVLSVKKEARPYPEAHLLLGSVFALLALLLLLFHPYEFDVRWMPLDVTLAFGFGFGLSHSLISVRRWLLSGSNKKESAGNIAKVLFHDLGITRTTGRSGILVVAFLLEREVSFVFDTGIPENVRQAFIEKKPRFETALREDSFEGFANVVESLCDPCGAALPRQADDVNELSDDVA